MRQVFLTLLLISFHSLYSNIRFMFYSLTNCNLIVDREIDLQSLAEGIPVSVKYTFYNTYGK